MRKYPLILVLMLLSQVSGCSQETWRNASSSKAESKQPSLIPEYQPSKAAVFSMGEVLPRVYYNKLGLFGEAFVQERFGMYMTIIKSMPELSYYFYSDPTLNIGEKNADELLKSSLSNPLRSGGYRVQEIWPKDGTSNEVDADEWTRDYVPLSYRQSNGQTSLLLYSTRGRQANDVLVDSLGETNALTAEADSDSDFAAGNIMTDSAGRCFFVGAPAQLVFQQFVPYCRKLIFVPPLSGEETGHIDLVAKLVNDTDAVISVYHDTTVEVLDYTDTVTFKCSDAAIADREWERCEQTTSVRSAQRVSTRSGPNGLPLAMDISAAGDYFRRQLGNSHTPVTMDTREGPVDYFGFPTMNWPSEGEALKTILRHERKTVREIPAPRPIIEAAKHDYFDLKGSLVRSEIALKLIFRSYTNALVTNGKAFVPTFPLTGNAFSDSTALSIYQDSGLEAFGVPSDYASLGGGAVHCLSAQIAK